MNVREFLEKVNKDEVVKELAGYFDAETVEDMLDDFVNTEPVVSDRVMIEAETITSGEGRYSAPVNLMRWYDILGAEISDECFENCTEAKFAARLFEAMVEYGFDELDRESEIERQLEGWSLVI